MKRVFLLLTTAALLLSGCVGTQIQEPPPEENDSLTLETLAVEIPRDGQDTDTLRQAAKTLPALLQQALADQGVAVGEVRITVGSSHAATAQALSQGSVDLAFLPAQDLAQQAEEVPVILLSGPSFQDCGTELENWNSGSGQAAAGHQGLICTAPTEYGRNLARRAGDLTWEELTRARWGVLREDSLLCRQAVDLWLADHYEGNTLSDLSEVTVFGDETALLKAAAAGEIDLFPMDASLRDRWTNLWTLSPDELDRWGDSGLGRTAPLWEDVSVAGLTERFYDMAAAVQPDNGALADPRFAQALAAAIESLTVSAGEDTRQLAQAVFGTSGYTAAPEGALNAARRLETLA